MIAFLLDSATLGYGRFQLNGHTSIAPRHSFYLEC